MADNLIDTSLKAPSSNPARGMMKKGGAVKGFRDGGIYTADMGEPPQDIDGGSAPKKPAPKKPAPKKPEPKMPEVKKPEPKKEKMYAKGGSINGIAERGLTNCKQR
jgi:outer membrane biosynthesis protein TonB